MWPRWRGLFVFGDENSTITLRPVEGSWPKSGSAAMAPKSSVQNRFDRLMFRKPLTTLKPSTSGTFSCSQPPIAAPVTSGELWETRKSGKTTRV